MKDSLSRFRLPWRHRVLPEDATPAQVRRYAQECLENPSGDALLKHLIEEFRLDEQSGFIGGEEAIYENGKKDGLKYILSLITPE